MHTDKKSVLRNKAKGKKWIQLYSVMQLKRLFWVTGSNSYCSSLILCWVVLCLKLQVCLFAPFFFSPSHSFAVFIPRRNVTHWHFQKLFYDQPWKKLWESIQHYIITPLQKKMMCSVDEWMHWKDLSYCNSLYNHYLKCFLPSYQQFAMLASLVVLLVTVK